MLGRKFAGSVLAVVAALTLSSCSHEEKEAVIIAADPSDPEQLVLAEIYRQVAELDGRRVGIVGKQLRSETDKLELLQTREANLAVFCAGSLIDAENPEEKDRLRKELTGSDNSNDAELELATYDAAVGTLPGSLMTLDPSPAHGCAPADDAEADSEDALPQNIMPVFQIGLFDRSVRQAMGKVTRALNTDDLGELVEQTAEDGDPTRAVNEWMREKTGMGAQLKRIVEEGEARDGQMG